MTDAASPAEAQLGFDPHRSDVLDDPFTWYAWLRRRERAYRVEGKGFHVVSRFDDVVTVTKEHGIFSSTGGVGFSWAAEPMMSMYDPPDHSRLRRLVAPAFTPKTIAALRPAIVEESRRLLDAHEETTFDFVEGYAEPLVAALIADILGLPRELVPQFRRWSLSITGILAGNLDPAEGESDRRELVAAIKSARRDGRGLIQVLAAAEDVERLTTRELNAFCVLLLIAGFETTVNGLANVAHALVRHCPDWRAFGETEGTLARHIEEALRLDPPVHAFFRNTLRPYELPDGSAIPEKTKVMVLFASANHDEARFASPERFDPLREPLNHVSFGNGVHYCIGAPLARTLYDVVFRSFVERGERLELAGESTRTRNSIMRGFTSLPVRFVR